MKKKILFALIGLLLLGIGFSIGFFLPRTYTLSYDGLDNILFNGNFGYEVNCHPDNPTNYCFVFKGKKTVCLRVVNYCPCIETQIAP